MTEHEKQVRDTRVWYRKKDAQNGEDSIFSALMAYQEAAEEAERLAARGYVVEALISQQQFLERAGNAMEEPEEPNEALREAQARMEKTVTRQGDGESRRLQALDWALRLAEVHAAVKTGGVVLKDPKPVTAAEVVADAKVFERYLKGSQPRSPKN